MSNSQDQPADLFSKVALRCTNSSADWSRDICPDQYVGSLGQLGGNRDFQCRLPVDSRPNSACFVLILESPHIHEFRGLPGPAKGRTGIMIRSHLMEVVGAERARRDVGILLVNAIQFQCSLGVPTSKYRDAVFTECWKAFGQNDFEYRVARLWRRGDCVINACTKGGCDLRLMVERALERAIGRSNLRRAHPSTWWRPDRRLRSWESQRESPQDESLPEQLK